MQEAHGRHPRPQSCHRCLGATGPQRRLLLARQPQGVNDGGRKQGDVELVNFDRLLRARQPQGVGDVELVNFGHGLDGSNSLVIDVSIYCDHIGNSTVNNGHLDGKMQTNDHLQERAWVKNIRYKDDYAGVGTAFTLVMVSVAGEIHPEFLRLWGYGSWLTNRRLITMRLLAQRRRSAARL